MAREKCKTIEILSPGKNLLYSKEAIRCGADAVYIGAPKFSLRHEQANAMDDIRELIEYAHRYWAKIYIPLNCLLYSDEDIKTAQNMINEFYEMGVDGLIIQDIGILELDLPPIPIILSTNSMCFKKEDAQFFEKCGVTRIVLPRELSFEEIKDITDNSNIEIETFCYGFLCVGYSGNCYLAYVESLKNTKSTEKSHYLASNHGVCPERCMDNWTLKDKNGNVIKENDRLLNLRFLNINNDMPRLFDIGVDSFKIAGREKDLKHVKNSTAMFSQTADIIAKTRDVKRASSGRVILGFEPDFHKNFNKGFTDFFMNGRKKENYSKHSLVGSFVGCVKDFDNNSFELDTSIKLNIGDRLRYQLNDEEVQKVEIVDVKNERYFISPIEDNLTGLKLYRYIDKEGFKEVEESVNYRVISVKLNFKENKVIAIDEDNNTIEMSYVKGSNRLVNPQKELFYLDIDCEFVIDEVNSQDGVYIDNVIAFRNELFIKLRAERAKNRPIKQGNVLKNNTPYYKKEMTYLDNVSNKKTEEFFRRHGVEKIEAGLETSDNFKGRKVFIGRYCLRNELGLCSKTNPSNLPPLPWTLEQVESGIEYKVEFDCKKCEMNFYCEE